MGCAAAPPSGSHAPARAHRPSPSQPHGTAGSPSPLSLSGPVGPLELAIGDSNCVEEGGSGLDAGDVAAVTLPSDAKNGNGTVATAAAVDCGAVKAACTAAAEAASAVGTCSDAGREERDNEEGK